MPREQRHESAGAIHHAIPQGVGRRAIVFDDRDREGFFARTHEAQRLFGWDVLAGSLLDTHVHLVIRTSEPNLGKGIGWLVGGHARLVHARHGGQGALFEPRFWSRRILEESDLLRAALYVDLNPVAAGLATHPAGFPWGTYNRPRHWLVGLLGDDLATATRAYAAIVDEACRQLRAASLPETVDLAVLQARSECHGRRRTG